MEIDKEQNWMPVFTIIESKKKRFASYPGQESSIHNEGDSDNEDYELRVGTATGQNDGIYKINLVVFPVDGRLIIRPPNKNEQQDMTKRVR